MDDVGAYDASGALIASTTVDEDGQLSEPLDVPAGGFMLVRVAAFQSARPTVVPVAKAFRLTRMVGGT